MDAPLHSFIRKGSQHMSVAQREETTDGFLLHIITRKPLRSQFKLRRARASDSEVLNQGNTPLVDSTHD
jgi:hypothetical protein